MNGCNFLGGGRIPGLTYDQKLAEADKLYSTSAAAYMSDPRLCSSLRLPHPVDNKNGKDFEGKEGGDHGGGNDAGVATQLVVKEEVAASVQGSDYVLSHAGYATLTNPTSSPSSSLTYTLPDQQAISSQQAPSILYMYPGPDSPKVNFGETHPGGVHPASSGVSPPTLRLASPVNVLSLAGHEARLQGDPTTLNLAPNSSSSSTAQPISSSSSVLSTTCCTFSLSDFGAVSPLVQESNSILQPSSSSLPLPVSEVEKAKARLQPTTHNSTVAR